MRKTLNFAAIHFAIAFSVAYILTGDILIGSLIAMIEPTVNTVAFYFHERIWSKSSTLQRFAQSTKIKTMSFASVHFSVAFGVVYILTGDAFIGGVMAIIEPAFNTCAYYFHEKVWQRKHSSTWQCAH